MPEIPKRIAKGVDEMKRILDAKGIIKPRKMTAKQQKEFKRELEASYRGPLSK